MNEFKFEIPLQIRFGDFDMLGHLNNAVYLTYFEVARIRYFYHIGWELDDVSNVVAHFNLDFLVPVVPQDELVVKIRTAKLGNKSFEMEYLLVSPNAKTIFSRGTSTQVCFNKTDGKSTPIPDHIRTLIIKFENL